MNNLQILLIEDEHFFAKAVSKRLEKEGFACYIATTLQVAQQYLYNNTVDLILLDMRLPDGSGLDFLRTLRESGQPATETAVVVLTAFGELEDAVSAMKLHALDFLKKPIDLDTLVNTIQQLINKEQLKQKIQYQPTPHSDVVQLLGNSPLLHKVRQQITRMGAIVSQAEYEPPHVLILGETGTGKDVCAHLLHHTSQRANRPFIQVDCAALPAELIEAELFGHEKGAYTHAHTTRKGLIETAENGTVFLDEVGELPLELQTKLLAVLGRRMVRRIGSTQERRTEAWFIAATHRPLARWVEEGKFRADLYYRLNTLTIELPALRHCGQDSLVLAQYFAQQAAQRYGLPVPIFSPTVCEQILQTEWRGNVRELRHTIERAVLLSDTDILDLSHALPNQTSEVIPLSINANSPDIAEPLLPSTTNALNLEQAERLLIEQALTKTAGNVSQAARLLGITRMALRYRLQKHGLKAQDNDELATDTD
ncbi:response regulator with CheY-like receiver, AAA-type ATPase, and DNA-binding domains [Beggiatoa alba B18LD]|uniref:Response regulator with CheY-like receiver, AAA-type ATPase, and DNA-binding domains n=1 Tax=Beggiatoa alba B18LD TaxID=395493 RepID=I3CD59_9GAMM|nr:sigma-54 dependent transcriptional regulator [Beggiatoa alba]EIJ41552.1 response regulator with CheY-like receiver, AAA-type ATPase, and DNA-binding domains [Beggiatoa alba B18LD]